MKNTKVGKVTAKVAKKTTKKATTTTKAVKVKKTVSVVKAVKTPSTKDECRAALPVTRAILRQQCDNKKIKYTSKTSKPELQALVDGSKVKATTGRKVGGEY